MAFPYRTAPSPRPVVLAVWGRAVGALLAISALLLVVTVAFSTRARVTVSCERRERTTTCHVEQAVAWRAWEHEVVLENPTAINIVRIGPDVTELVATPWRVIVSTPLEASELSAVEELVRDIALPGSTRTHGFAHAGGFLIDARIVFAGGATALLLVTLALRRHRVVLDRARNELRATTYAGFLPWNRRTVVLREDDRVSVDRTGGKPRLVVVQPNGARAILLAEEGSGRHLDELATQLTHSLNERTD